MIRALWLLVALVAMPALAQRATRATERPRTTKQVPKPPPAPEPELQPEPEPDEGEPEPDTVDALDDVDVAPPASSNPEVKDDDALTEDELAGIGILGGCCCFGGIALGGLVVWLVMRKRPAPGPTPLNAPMVLSKPPPSTAGVVPQPLVATPPLDAPTSHLSVLSLAVPVRARAELETHLLRAGATGVLEGAEARARLVREAAKALQASQAQWGFFGYGEKVAVPSDAELQRSYLAAVDDFRARANGMTPVAGEGWVVISLVIATRARILGVSRLDDRAQVQAALHERGSLDAAKVLGAELVWAPAASGFGWPESSVRSVFPEMSALPVTPG